ncbi:MAG TPA: disulfide bond formation protein B [Pseudoxanthomonas sp.]|nr:disulfide bond formation protein B [Pseudoxanthomonas sp.]
MNPFRWSFRMQFLLGFLACVAVVGYAIWTQLHDGLEPCNLCIFQRVSFALLAVVFLVGALHAPRTQGGRRGYGIAAFVAAGIGIGIAARHVWVQSLPADLVPSCGPPLGFLQESVGVLGMIKKVLTASGSCGTIDWTLLGLAMPAWSLICFIVLALWALYAGFSSKKVS